MTDWVEVIIQGLVQGITEFLPVSSTGHLLVFSALMEFENSNDGAFEIFIQIGTLVAVIGFFRKSLWYQATHVIGDKSIQQLWLNIVIGSIPMGVLGLLFMDYITEEIFPPDVAPSVIAVTLILGGLVFLWIETRDLAQADEIENESAVEKLDDITHFQALIIGFAQALALIPGTSRSGASIVGGLLVGLDRTKATRFSFYLAMPALAGASLIQLISVADELNRTEFGYFIGGALVAGGTGWLSIAWLLRYVASRDFRIFGYYRIASGILLIILLVLGVL